MDIENVKDDYLKEQFFIFKREMENRGLNCGQMYSEEEINNIMEDICSDESLGKIREALRNMRE